MKVSIINCLLEVNFQNYVNKLWTIHWWWHWMLLTIPRRAIHGYCCVPLNDVNRIRVNKIWILGIWTVADFEYYWEFAYIYSCRFSTNDTRFLVRLTTSLSIYLLSTHTQKNECIQILPFYEHKLLICVLIFTAVTWFRQFFFIIVVIFKICGLYWRCIDAKECIKQKSSVTFLENASSTSIYRMSI